MMCEFWRIAQMKMGTQNWILKAFLASFLVSPVLAQDASMAEQARRLYQRIAGVPPSTQELRDMTQLMSAGQTDAAAFIALQNLNFYKSTLHNMFTPLMNNDRASNVALGDSVATIIGLIYNNERFDQVLYGDVIYVADSSLVDTMASDPLLRSSTQNPAAGKIRALLAVPTTTVDMVQTPDYTRARYSDANHYVDLESRISNWPQMLRKETQSRVYSLVQAGDINNLGGVTARAQIPAEEIAGILTTRQFGQSLYQAGTNRRAISNTMNAFFCSAMDELHDTSAPDSFVRQDVDRSPAGDSRTFRNQCQGCHAGMDALAGAFAYMDFVANGANGQLSYKNQINATSQQCSQNQTPFNGCSGRNGVFKQFRQDTVYPAGYRLRDNSWTNLWADGPNARLGWRTINGVSNVRRGSGMKSLGKVLATTTKFSECMAQRVFERVCLRSPTPSEREALKKKALAFEAGFSAYEPANAQGPYNMRALFANVSSMCFGN